MNDPLHTANLLRDLSKAETNRFAATVMTAAFVGLLGVYVVNEVSHCWRECSRRLDKLQDDRQR